MVMKKVRTIIVIIVLVLLIGGVTGFIIVDRMSEATYSNNTYGKTIDRFYKEAEGSLDGVYIGSSAAYRYWNAPKAYEDYGMAVYCMGTYVQPITLASYLLKEADKHQSNLKFAVVELRNIAKPPESYDDNNLKLVTDAMPYSLNRAAAIRYYVEYCEKIGAEIDTDIWDYYLPMLRERGEWAKTFTADSLEDYTYDSENVFKGFTPAKADTAEYFEDKGEISHREPLTAEQKELLGDLAETADEVDFEVIFVLAPTHTGQVQNGIMNSACDYMESKGCTVLNFNLEPLRGELGMNWATDFYNRRHVTITGADRYTEYLSAYLADNFDLEDHRGEEGYESWDAAVEKMKEYLFLNTGS